MLESGSAIGMTSNEALAEYRGVINNAGNAEYPSGTTQACKGITQNAVASGEKVTVEQAQETFLECDGSGTAIIAGDFLACGATGIGVKAGSGDYKSFKALRPCTTASTLIPVEIIPDPQQIP